MWLPTTLIHSVNKLILFSNNCSARPYLVLNNSVVAIKLKVLSTLDGPALLFIVNGKTILYLLALNKITPLLKGEKILRKQPPSLIVQKQVPIIFATM